MNYYVMTLFPEMIENGMHTSIIGRAMAKGLLTLQTINIRDFSTRGDGRIDDYPYGGGAGMVMQAEPVYRAYTDLAARIGHRPRLVYLTPQGKTFTQQMAKELALEEDLVFLCGHYEGIDERVLDEIATDYISIGDYVLTGGELPSMVLMDSISRMVPGVLSNQESGETESFSGSLLEYPQYSRPEVWHDTATPPVLMSGHHANVERWRRDQSLYRTLKHRPDLLDGVELDKKDRKFLCELLEKEPVEQLPFTSGTAAWSGEKGVADPYPVRDTEQKVLRKLLAISNKA
ncbi:MAG: tRNA (guanosine(37)-N1)-methyltransferase TrmD [Lachnospiraceae bacterium]|nr:tRNA (guanosine(37)-N1)-methyltransferase TrmD [Lachnospiraceae bacterium]